MHKAQSTRTKPIVNELQDKTITLAFACNLTI